RRRCRPAGADVGPGRDLDGRPARFRAVGPPHWCTARRHMSLDVDIDHALGSFHLTARFAAQPGVTALFGRSGSGKTTLVNIVGGLIRPNRGRVVVDGETLVDTERGLFAPKHPRRVAYVLHATPPFPH